MGRWMILGAALQVVGLIVTAYGVRQTWREFGTERFWAFVTEPVRRAWDRVGDTVRRLVRRSAPPQVEGSLGVVVGVAGMTARGRVGFPVIPADQAVADSIMALDQRTRDMMERLDDVRDRLDDDLSAAKRDIDRLRLAVEDHIERLEGSDRRVAVSGLRVEAVGLFLIALGVTVQGMGSV
jgi:hypothetical protein